MAVTHITLDTTTRDGQRTQAARDTLADGVIRLQERHAVHTSMVDEGKGEYTVLAASLGVTDAEAQAYYAAEKVAVVKILAIAELTAYVAMIG